MRKIKKALALSLALAMGLSLVACGDSDSTESTTTAAPTEEATEADTSADSEDASEADSEEASEDTAASAGIAAPSTDGWTEDQKIYAYSWDEDFSKKLNIVLEKFPEYKDYVEFVTLGVGGTSDEYKTAIDTALESGDKYPSLIPADNDVAKYWSELDVTANLDELGFTDDVMANSYDFAKQYGTYDGHLKAVTWQGTPGSVFYRRDIAKDVFGTDDPDTIQEKLSSWDNFFAAADELAAKGYKIVSGPSDVKYAIWDTQSSAWVTTADDGTETLTLDNAVSDYLETGKKIYDGGYSNNTSLWDSSWAADMTDDSKVFCYFGCPWFIGSMQGNGATNGNWGAVTGPTSYHWGGTYVMVGKDTNNAELCAFLLYELTCDPDIGVEITNQTGDFVNNKAANDRLINGELASDNNAATFLGGQNPIEVWASSVETLDLSYLTYSDASIKNIIDEAATAYNAGTYATVDDAIKYIQDTAATQLNLTVAE